MKTKYIQDGSNFNVTKDLPKITDHLPVGTYTVNYSQQSDSYGLKKVEDFGEVGRIYGNMGSRADRVMTTFLDRPVSTGVALCGEKGSGKTMLAKLLSKRMADMGYPTIVINQPYGGEKFNQFLQSIDTPCVVIFDEFEKVYDRDAQEGMLTILDGVYSSRKLFVLTTNEMSGLNRYMLNRPGRIFYNYTYRGIDEEVIRQYCSDNLKDKGRVQSVIKIASVFDAFNFDMLKALIEEMNRYDLDAASAVDGMNISPETYREPYDVFVTDGDGNVITFGQNNVKSIEMNLSPFDGFGIHIEHPTKKDSDGDPETHYVHVSADHLIRSSKGDFTYSKEGYTIRAVKKQYVAPSMFEQAMAA